MKTKVVSNTLLSGLLDCHAASIRLPGRAVAERELPVPLGYLRPLSSAFNLCGTHHSRTIHQYMALSKAVRTIHVHISVC